MLSGRPPSLLPQPGPLAPAAVCHTCSVPGEAEALGCGQWGKPCLAPAAYSTAATGASAACPQGVPASQDGSAALPPRATPSCPCIHPSHLPAKLALILSDAPFLQQQPGPSVCAGGGHPSWAHLPSRTDSLVPRHKPPCGGVAAWLSWGHGAGASLSWGAAFCQGPL